MSNPPTEDCAAKRANCPAEGGRRNGFQAERCIRTQTFLFPSSAHFRSYIFPLQAFLLRVSIAFFFLLSFSLRSDGISVCSMHTEIQTEQVSLLFARRSVFDSVFFFGGSFARAFFSAFSHFALDFTVKTLTFDLRCKVSIRAIDRCQVASSSSLLSRSPHADFRSDERPAKTLRNRIQRTESQDFHSILVRRFTSREDSVKVGHSICASFVALSLPARLPSRSARIGE